MSNKKLKLAYFSPLPPQKSGISYYSELLLPYLRYYYEIDVIVDLESSKEFEKSFYKYDRILYHFGNSHFHTFMIPLIQKYTGVVVLHDFVLRGAYDTKLFTKSFIYQSYGYAPHCSKHESIDFPYNKTILNQTYGVISHATYQQKIAKELYPQADFKNWFTIPLIRIPTTTIKTKEEKSKIKQSLGYKADTFLIVSFGLLGTHKQNHLLIDAFLASQELSQNSQLIFVGDFSENSYATLIKSKIAQHPQISITGWVDDDTYKEYLNIADIAVQLRNNSAGESSAAVLDTLNHHLPTIVNSYGSFQELPSDALLMLQEDCTQEELTQALIKLYNDKDLRETLASKASKYIATHHNPDLASLLYYKAIETSYTNKTKESFTSLIKTIKNLQELVQTTALLDPSQYRQTQILVDISAIHTHNLKTGIQRVVMEQLKQLLQLSPKNIRIEPVYLKKEDTTFKLYYARKYTTNYLLHTEKLQEDTIVTVSKGDIFYSADLAIYEHTQAIKSDLFKYYKNLGLKIIFLIHDILPLINQEYFPQSLHPQFKEWFQHIASISDLIINTTHTTKAQIQTYAYTKNFPLPTIEVLPLGADIEPFQATFQPAESKATIDLLIVGTIEPRKGHFQLLQAFDILMEQNLPFTLTIVGKEGWEVEETLNAIKSHPNLGINLFYLSFVDDTTLAREYQKADAIIVASYAEGFGLPLLEAAYFQKDLIVRDIDVFREILGDYPIYFKDTKDPQSIVDTLKNYLFLPHIQKAPPTFQTWETHVKALITLLTSSY